MPENSGKVKPGGDVGAVGGDHPSEQEVKNAVHQLPESKQAGLPESKKCWSSWKRRLRLTITCNQR